MMNVTPQDFRLGFLSAFEKGQLIFWHQDRLLSLNSFDLWDFHEPDWYFEITAHILKEHADFALYPYNEPPLKFGEMLWLDWVIKRANHFVPTAEAWQKFWNKLDEMGVWNWEESYLPPADLCIRDGHHYWIYIKYGEKNLKTGSYNSRAPNFDKFELALSELMGEKSV